MTLSVFLQFCSPLVFSVILFSVSREKVCCVAGVTGLPCWLADWLAVQGRLGDLLAVRLDGWQGRNTLVTSNITS
jgi:hypothetical protein